MGLTIISTFDLLEKQQVQKNSQFMTDFLYALIKSIVIKGFKMGIPENDIIRIKHHISGS
jgi:hypothetical protein